MTQVQTAAGSAPVADPAFRLVRSAPIPALNLVLEEYRHLQTGAQHFHFAAPAKENVFLVAFRTVPMDSTGVAHVLEHTTLCGSERYPVRDPFFMMSRRSLNTFMNAFTSSDWTAYPFASQNHKDFFNLMDVYLDAVFFPRLDPLDFAQEGHRLEFTEPADPTTPLVYKGVVYNEMKGAMSSPISVLWQTLCKYLYPTTTYHYNSGGDPQHITDLSYEQLVAFYRSHYHPSNAMFMTYGDLPASAHQARIQERALARFEALDVDIRVAEEKRYFAPLAVEEAYPLEAEQAATPKTHIVMGWLLGKTTSLYEQLAAHVLSGVLLDNSASPLRQALETCGLGSGPSPLCGVEDSYHEMCFICGIEGATPDQATAVEKLVLEVLEQVAERGIAHEDVEAVLHQLELSQREISGDSYPYGLNLLLEALAVAVHRGDPLAQLDLDPVLERLREEARDPEFIKRLVRSQLLDNPHRVRVSLKPDTGLEARRAAADAARLQAKQAAIPESEQRRLVAQAEALAARQAHADDPSVLPRVRLDDIPADLEIAEGESLRIAERPAMFFGQGTNGLTYQQLIIELPHLEPDLLDVLPIYTRCLTEVGCGARDYLQMQEWQYRISGGVGAYTSLRSAVADYRQMSGHIVVSGKALARNHGALTELMHTILHEARFDEHARIQELVAQRNAQMEQSVVGNGHYLAMLAATSGLAPLAGLNHRLRGLQGIRASKALDGRLRSTSDDAEQAIAALAQQLAQIHARVQQAPLQCLLIAEPDARGALRQDWERVWSAPAKDDFTPFAAPSETSPPRQMWLTSTQVNFCAKAYATVPGGHADAAPLLVLGGFLVNGYLHRAIREQGGAYGGGAAYDADEAAFRFYSYRDPRLMETLADFDGALSWLAELQDTPVTQRQLEEAILGVISGMDKPASPAGEAKKAFYNALYGRTPDYLRDLRRRVTAVSLADLQRVAATYMQPDQARVAVISNTAMAQQAEEAGLEVFQL